MKNISKRRQALLAKIEKGKEYSIDEGAVKVKELKSANFDETVEMSVWLNVDPRHADQMIRGAVVLPHGTGKKVRVAVFAKGAKAEEAKEAGADIVGQADLADEIIKGRLDFDVVIATPDMMPVVAKASRILGPKGLMPNPKVGTVNIDVVKAIKDAKGGQVSFRVDKKGNIHAGIGKVSFSADAIKENALSLVTILNKLKPSTAKGRYIKKATLSLTMSPSVVLDSKQLMDVRG